jgi:hypothetical protein
MTFVPISLPALMPAVIAALIGWRIYRRVRRLIGRQPVRPRRLVMTMILFPILLVLASLSGLRDILMFEALAAGVVIGVALSFLGLRLTRFETADSRFYYIPNATIGVGISMLFIGRLIYRFGVLYFSTGRFDPATMQTFGSSPLTLGIFGVVASYYTAYAVGVLVWYRKHQHEIALPITPANIAGT